MTLILSIATPEFVLQVSDRRLMRVTPTGVVCDEDDANKLTVFCNRMVFGYTGLARIDNQRTDVWLVHTLSKLSDNNLAVVVTQLKERATDAFSRLNYNSQIKRHAFIGVGWTRANLDEPVFPMMCRISNYHDEHGRALDVAQDVFALSFTIHKPPKPSWGWLEAGACMTDKEISRLHRYMKRCAKNLTGPVPVVRHFISTIRNISLRNNTVGENCLAVIIPKSVAFDNNTTIMSPGGWGISTGGFNPSLLNSNKRIVSVYIPKNKTRGIEYTPNFACRGIAVSNVIQHDL